MPRISPAEGFSVFDIAARTNGTVVGDGNVRIRGICSLDEPEAQALAFSKERSAKRLAQILGSKQLGALLVTAPLPDLGAEPPPFPIIVVADPLAALVSVIPLFVQPYAVPAGASEFVVIHPTAKIGERVAIGPFSTIGEGCVIESDVIIHPHVTLYPGVRIGRGAVLHAGAIVREDCVIGAGSVIQNGAVIGSDGFGYLVIPDKGLVPVPQVGTVVLGAHVDVGANTCIDRATLGTTRIGTATKVDNLVQIGHNVTIGSHTIVCGQAGIAGSCTIGDRVVLGGGVGIADHLSVGDGVRVGGASCVMNDLTTPGDYAGSPPTVPMKQWLSQIRAIRRLLRGGQKGGVE